MTSMLADSQAQTLDPRTHIHAMRELVRLLTRHRQLTWEMTKREITERYAGQAIGSLWAMLAVVASCTTDPLLAASRAGCDPALDCPSTDDS